MLRILSDIHTSSVTESVIVWAGDFYTGPIITLFVCSTGMPAFATVERVLIEIGDRPAAMGKAVSFNASLSCAADLPAVPAVAGVVPGTDTCPVTVFHTCFQGT
jgi:hypothetical protein